MDDHWFTYLKILEKKKTLDILARYSRFIGKELVIGYGASVSNFPNSWNMLMKKAQHIIEAMLT
jgi:hypothetical protein